ncbi:MULTISPECIES: mechanosensitive ion channel domain-containing protein [unclassified Ekhidna]|uniref:mechanosensitive ion channel domain-containing protein n=1 Tax=unclassified Ekhidna TaxID=2632188 RepID=UPI0032DE38C5
MKKIFLLLTLMIALGAFAQDSLRADSIERRVNSLSQQLETYERLLQQNSEKRKQDSLARADLLRKIQILQESDRVNKASLHEQVREIEQRDSIRNAMQRERILNLRKSTKGFVVAPFGDSLFTVYTKLGPVMAEERAKNVTEKIELLVRDDYFYQDSLLTVPHDGTIDVMYNDLIVTSVSDWDALWMVGITKDSLANNYKTTISDFVLNTRNRSTVQNIAARIGLIFLIIGGVILVLYFIRRLANGLQGWMILNKKKYFTGVRIKSYELLPPDLHLEVGLKSISILKWGLYVLTFYLSLPLVFGLFPFTRGWAQTLLNWILGPAENIWYSFWNYLPNVFTIAVIYFITSYLVKFLKFIASEIENGHLSLPGFYSDWAMPTYRLVKLLVYAFMLVMIWPYLPGSDSDIFKGVSVFIGLLISFGSTSAIANAVAGLVITYMRPFKLGDRVKIGEVTGEIVEKTLLVTRVRTVKNEDITVPNSSILTGHTVNYSSSSKELGLILNTSVTIGYDVPWRKVHELLVEAAVATDGINISREPFVLQTSLDDWYVSYQLNAYTDVPERMAGIYSELHGNIQDKFNEAGIEIMSPRYSAVRDGNASTIPEKGK